MHFIERKPEALLKKYGMHYKYGLGYHPQDSGSVENSNREIKSIVDETVARSRKDWADKVADAPYRTSFKTPVGSTPF